MKFTKLALAAVMAASMVACSSGTTSETTASTSASASASASAEEEVVTSGKYTFVNVSRTEVAELYVYATGSEDKGDNYLSENLGNGDSIVVDVNVDEAEADGYASTVEIVDANGDSAIIFDNLHLEEATLLLQSVSDVESGATPFFQKGNYTLVNNSGETITEVYFYETGSDDKGDNQLSEDLAEGAEATVEISVASANAPGYTMTVEFVTESGATAVVFDNLHIETATMYLKAVSDVEGGATPFSE